MTTVSEDKLRNAMKALGGDASSRRRIVEICREAETALARLDFNVREEVTGPIVDAAFAGVDSITLTLDNGIVFECPYRSKIARDIVMRDPAAADHIFEPQTTKLLLRLSSGAKHVFVGGAYCGDHVILIAKDIAPSGGTVHAFEPNAEQMAMLKKNAKTNGLTNIAYKQLGLWDHLGARLSFVGADALASVEVVEEGGFPVTTMEAYGEQAGITSIDVIMLDIEGSEFAALRGAEHFLKQPAGQAPNIVFEVHSSYLDWSHGLDKTDIAQYLMSFGYTLYGVRDYQSNALVPGPVELVPAQTAYLKGPPHGFNMLAVKDTSIIAAPFFRITPDVSPKLLRHRDPRLHSPSA